HLVYVGFHGRGELIVDFTPVPLGAGWLTVVPRGRVHQYTARSRNADAWMLLFTPEFLHAGAHDALGAPSLLSSRAEPSLALDASLRRELLLLCGLLAAEYARPIDALQPALLASMSRAILLRIERQARSATPLTPPGLARFFAELERNVFAKRSV